MVTEEEIAYYAGFFDGEGCVTSNGQGYLNVVISGNNLEVLQEMKERFGGNIHTRPNGTSNLSLSTQLGKAFLETLLPFLRVKREVAIQGLALASTQRGNPNSQEKEDIRREIHRLNKINSPRSGPKSRFERIGEAD